MRRTLIAGNWKMNLSRAEATELAKGVAAAKPGANTDVLVCPSNVYLDAVSNSVTGSSVAVGGQDVYFEAGGAFTGETSTDMLKEVGCTHVILGHSERRNVIGECDKLVNKKLHAALAAGLTPVLCVGELLEERESGKTTEVVQNQIKGSLADVTADQMAKIVIAYEPVWAIGTGKTASPEQAQEVHAFIRAKLAKLNAATAQAIQIVYGGSVKPKNALELFGEEDIDGGLIGGAALNVESFVGICETARKLAE